MHNRPIQHRTVLIIFPLVLLSIINANITVGEKGFDVIGLWLCRSGYDISGEYIMASSLIGQFGDQVTLFSPMRTFAEGTEMSFYFHMRISIEDKTAALSVYTYSQLRVFEHCLLEIRGNHGTSWQQVAVCLPGGTYQLAFVATHGLQLLSDIALDEIILSFDDSEPCELPENDKYGGKYLSGTIPYIINGYVKT